MSDDAVTMKLQKPAILAKKNVILLVTQIFGLTDVIVIRELDSYDDRNYQIEGICKDTEGNAVKQFYTLKIHNGVESGNPTLLDAQNQALLLLHKNGIQCPYPKATLDGNTIGYSNLSMLNGCTKRLAVRLLHWIPGKPLVALEPDVELLEKAGKYLAQVDKIMHNFQHQGVYRTYIWDLQQTEMIIKFTSAVTDPKRRELIEKVVKEFQDTVKPLAPVSKQNQFKDKEQINCNKVNTSEIRTIDSGKLRMGVIQGDFNDANIIISDSRDIAGIIDFGDISYTYLINNLAIGMAYTMVSKFGLEKPWDATCSFYKGYIKQFPIFKCEKNVLWTLVACRLAISHTMGMYSFSKDPNNKYLLIHAEPAYTALETLRKTSKDTLMAILEDAEDKNTKLATITTSISTNNTDTAIIDNSVDHIVGNSSDITRNMGTKKQKIC